MSDPQSSVDDGVDDAKVEEILRRGPSGAFAVAGVATAIVVAIDVGVYFLVYLPRGAVQ
jgi:hypothetical protein